MMSKCVMCDNDFEGNDLLAEGLPICPICAKKIDTLEHSEDIVAAKRAYHYVFNCAEQTNNPRVSAQLSAILDRHPALADSAPVHPLYSNHAFRKKQHGETWYEESNNGDNPPYKPPFLFYVFRICGIALWIIGGVFALASYSVLSKNMNNAYKLVFTLLAFCVFFLQGALPLALAHILDKLSKIEYNTSFLQ